VLYRVLADLTVLIHFLWILFLVSGAFWGKRSRAVRGLHVGGLAFAVAIQVSDWYCPLTHLESWLRSRHAPETAYSGYYLVHYLEKVVYLDMSRTFIVALTAALCLFNLWFYLKR
jgi:hypothetical protein